MDHNRHRPEARRSMSLGRTSSTGSSVRRHSFNQTGLKPFNMVDDIESESVSEAGDVGNRALHSRRYSLSGSLSFDNNPLECGAIFPLQDALLHQHGSWSNNRESINTAYLATPVQIVSPLPTDALFHRPNETKVSLLKAFLLCYF